MSHSLMIVITALVVAVVNYYLYFAFYVLFERQNGLNSLKAIAVTLFLALTGFEMMQTKPFLLRGLFLPEDVTTQTGLVWFVIVVIPVFMVYKNYQKLER